MPHWLRPLLILFLGLILSLLLPRHALAASVTLAWEDPNNTAPLLGGYRLYYWQLGSDKQVKPIGPQPTCPSVDVKPGVKCTTIEGLAAGQFYQFNVTAVTSDGTEESAPSETITHYVDAPGEFVLDDSAATFEGDWNKATTVPNYFGDYYHVNHSSRSATATWQVHLPQDGVYEVFAWWSSDDSDTPAAPYTIHHAGGVDTVRVNQTQSGGQWVRLGAYRFATSQAARVVLKTHEAAPGWVVADAIRFLQGGASTAPGELVLDDSAAMLEGFWNRSTTVPNYFGDHYQEGHSSRSATATWQADLPQGVYEVYAWWTSDASDTAAAPYTIHHADGVDTVRVNQTKDGGQWVRLGVYRFATGQAARVVLKTHEAAEGWVVADAIRFLQGASTAPGELVLDDSMATLEGFWNRSTTVSNYFGDHYQEGHSSRSATATWQADLPQGVYEVYAWWAAASSVTSAAPYTVHHADGVDTVRVNQTENGGQWVLLGAYRFATDQAARVVLKTHEAAKGWVVADAIRFLRRN